MINPLEWFKKPKEILKLPVIVAIHGFGRRRTVEYAPLKTYFEKLGYVVVIPELFNQELDESPDADRWIERADGAVKEQLDAGNKVWLIGFSMGGVIAASLAAKYPVERVALLAPAFDYVTFKKVLGAAERTAGKLIKIKPISSVDSEPGSLPDNYYPIFSEVVKRLKNDIELIDVPVLFLHGTQDEVIPIRSSENAYKRIHHNDKLLLRVETAPHRLLDEVQMNDDILFIIYHFFKGDIVKESTLLH